MHGIGKIPDRQSKITCSPSALIKFAECPETYEWEYILGHKKETDAMDLGTMIHEAILEPHVFESKYIFHPKGLPEYSADELKAKCEVLGLKKSGTKLEMSLRIKEVEPDFDSIDLFIGNTQGKIVLTESKSLMIKTLVEKVKKTAMFSKIIEPAEKEQLLYFTHDTGVVVPFKCDAVLLGSKVIILDVKTSADASRRKFERDHKDMGRDIQAALYVEGIERVHGVKVDYFCWLVVETSAPYRVYEYAPDQAMIDNGKVRAHRLLEEFKTRHEQKDWSKRENGLIQTTLPSWAWEHNEDFYD